ncbi:MAG: cupredoxin domain-containing protein [Chloroflexota bacterium]
MNKITARTTRSKGARPGKGKSRTGPHSPSFRLRLLAFAAVVVVVATAAFILVRPFSGSAAALGTGVKIDMAGFAPPTLTAKAGETVTIRLTNPDSEFHTDGGGKHQFAIPELGVDAVVNPKSEKAITFTASTPGTYTFYCDICCGGKENPSMRGTLTVTA